MSNSEPFMKRAGAAENRYAELRQREREQGGGISPPTGEDAELINRLGRVRGQMAKLNRDRGRRYAECSFDNFEAGTDAQRQIVDQLKSYVRDAASIAGTNVVLFGPKGTGKDHLLRALATASAYFHGIVPLWRQGVDLHENLRREAFRDEGRSKLTLGDDPHDDEETTDVLWISDPLPPSGGLTEYQQAKLFGLIDRRYSDLRPTWITMNVADGSEAESRMGAQVVDRLRDGALVLNCNWPSYRKALQQTPQDAPGRTQTHGNGK